MRSGMDLKSIEVILDWALCHKRKAIIAGTEIQLFKFESVLMFVRSPPSIFQQRGRE